MSSLSWNKTLQYIYSNTKSCHTIVFADDINILVLIGNADIVRFIKSRRIAWLGHVMWMDEKRIP